MSEPDCIHSYLRLYGGELGERVLTQFPALHQPADPAWPALSLLKRRPFPAQQLAIMGIAKRWNEDPAKLHHEFATARDEFRIALRRVMAFHQPNATEAQLVGACRELLNLIQKRG